MSSPQWQRQRQEQSRQMRDRCKFVDGLLEVIPSDIVDGTARRIPHADGSVALRGPRGQLYGLLSQPKLALFLVDAAGQLRALTRYVRQLEAEAYEARQRRKTLEDAARSLLQAADAGLSTQQGQRHVQVALGLIRTR